MGTYFADLHATPESQLGGKKCDLADTPEVAVLRNAETFQALMALGKALFFQLRYREAIDAYTRAIALEPENITGYRQRAARYLATLQIPQATADFLRCRELGGDAEDLCYRLGLCHYLSGEYGEAMAELEKCYPLCDEEMGIAVIFWHTLSAWRRGTAPTLLKEKYHSGMKVGHHTGYAFAMGVASGYITDADFRLAAEGEDLEFSIMAYGVYVYREHLGMPSHALLEEILRRDGFWISYAYLAAWNDGKGREDVHPGKL
jgi:tetratricopeptide (TPR) repeat protein